MALELFRVVGLYLASLLTFTMPRHRKDPSHVTPSTRRGRQIEA